MRFVSHLVLSIALLALYPIIGSSAFIAMAASVLIDIDHVALLLHKKAFSVKGARFYIDNIDRIYQEDPENALKKVIYILHTVELNLLLAAASIWFPMLFPIFVGFTYHIITDALHHWLSGMPVRRWIFFSEFIRINITD
jgi:hypothetical protein